MLAPLAPGLGRLSTASSSQITLKTDDFSSFGLLGPDEWGFRSAYDPA
jgi:hypothetical protein